MLLLLAMALPELGLADTGETPQNISEEEAWTTVRDLLEGYGITSLDEQQQIIFLGQQLDTRVLRYTGGGDTLLLAFEEDSPGLTALQKRPSSASDDACLLLWSDEGCDQVVCGDEGDALPEDTFACGAVAVFPFGEASASAEAVYTPAVEALLDWGWGRGLFQFRLSGCTCQVSEAPTRAELTTLLLLGAAIGLRRRRRGGQTLDGSAR